MDIRTVQFALHVFLETKRAENSSPYTVEYYRRKITSLLGWMKEQGRDRLDEQTVRDFLAFRSQTENAYTLHSTYRALHHFCRWCLQNDLLQDDIMRRIKPPKREHLMKPSLTDDEVKRCLQACEGNGWLRLRDRALFLTLLDTGVRIHEAGQMKVGDLMQDAILITGKGKRQRIVHLSPFTKVAVWKYLQACPAKPRDDEPLWWGERGPLLTDGLKQVIRRIGERADVHLHPHKLRRTAATMCLRAGMGLEYVRRLLGHSDYRMTMEYLALVDDDLKEAHKEYSPVTQILGRRQSR